MIEKLLKPLKRHPRKKNTSFSNDKCLRLLRYMSALAKNMKNLNIHVDRAKLDDMLGSLVKAAVFCGQMQPNIFFRFSALLNDAVMKNLEYQLVHSNGQALTAVWDRVPIVPCLSQGLYLPYAVGIKEAQTKVIDLLDLKDSSCRVVVIYGIGWIGKMTRAFADFNRLEILLFIDNTLRIQMFLPVKHFSNFHMLSRILVTTRNFNRSCNFN